jgi:hypothetical protein
MRNGVQLLGLAAVLLTVSCHAFGTARGLAIVAALVTGALAWIAHRGHARAGGGTGDTGSTGSTTEADTTGSSTGSSTSSSTDSGTSGSTSADAGTLDSTASAGTAEPTSTTSATGDEGFETSACLSIAPPESCACEIDDDRDATDWAPALLLPAVALRRRSRRASLDRIAADGRLPEDVVARLRQRLDADHPK